MTTTRVAVATENFLPYTHVWIYRQMVHRQHAAALVLCRQRSEREAFPFEPCVCSPPPPAWMQRVRGRFSPLFRHLAGRLPRRSQRAFADAIAAHQIDLVHAHFGTMAVLLAPVCAAAGVPLLVTFHGFDVTAAPKRWPAYARQLTAMLQRGAHVAAITREMADVAVRLGADPSRVHLSYLGVPVAEIPFVDRAGRSGPVRFLHAGRITAKKGVPDLVRAFAAAFQEPGTAVLTIAGDGEERPQVDHALAEARPANEVRVTGRVSDAELVRLRHEADVFVANCRTDDAGTREGLPIAILEAAASGLPILSTVHAGIPEAIEHETSGLLVPERDHDALVTALGRMRHAGDRVRWGRAACQRMKDTFDLPICNERLWSIYSSCVGTAS